MPNESHIEGSANIVIQGVTDSTITISVDGKTEEITRKLDVILTWLQNQQATSVQTSGKVYATSSLNAGNLDFILGQVEHSKKLPTELAENLITADNLWVNSLKQEILKHGVSVGSTPLRIFEHYGWLIEIYLQKMETEVGRARSLRRLSFMAEAFQSAIRYLCYIQIGQLLLRENKPQDPELLAFFQMEASQHERYDFLLLLLLTTMLLREEETFMPEINDFVSELSDPTSDLYGTALFLEEHRNRLLDNAVIEDGTLESLLDEYLTGLVYWLRRLAFLAKYRLVSIKDINLNYRLGTVKNFVHVYGELHGLFTEGEVMDYSERTVKEAFTYNQSVLLFKGNDVDAGLANIHDRNSYLSLSPLVIDQSVFTDKRTQTPEIFAFVGRSNGKRNFRFAMYKNELNLGGTKAASNKELEVKAQNNQQPKLDELHSHLEQLLKPIKRTI
jgi:hypothetical protein